MNEIIGCWARSGKSRTHVCESTGQESALETSPRRLGVNRRCKPQRGRCDNPLEVTRDAFFDRFFKPVAEPLSLSQIFVTD